MTRQQGTPPTTAPAFPRAGTWCDCYRFPNMHDSAGVCTNWDRHENQPTPCPRWHYAHVDGTRKSNAESIRP